MELCETAKKQTLDLAGVMPSHVMPSHAANVAFAIGCRGKKTCQRLWNAIPAGYKEAHCFAAIWEAYSKVIAKDQLTQSETKAQTNHVERFNPTLRGRLGPLVRETNSFSKTDQMHLVNLTLFLHRYNQ